VARAAHRRRVVSMSATPPDPLEEAKAAAQAASPLPKGVTSEDLRKFYMIVDSQSWDEVQGKTLKMVHDGELTEGVVGAGEAVLQEAMDRKEDPRIISSLQDAVSLLGSALHMTNAPEGLRVADECANMMIVAGSPAAAEADVVAKLKGVFADPEVDVNPKSFLQDVEGFIANIEEQEDSFQEMMADAAEKGINEDSAQVAEFAQARATARRNLNALKDIVAGMV